MRPTTSNEIRQAFLEYFDELHHEVVSSSPLPQYDNPTLLFTNAGMNQFTDVFLGKEKRQYSRATSAQKVMRVQGKHNDLENVGPSPRHHTFFEMLGNFSFGDYFKEEAIDFAWQFATQVMELDKNRLWATIYTDDDESFELWKRYFPPERILRFGKKDNFWEMGEVGPCGPCSEMFYYVGDMETCNPAMLNDDDDQEFVEFWNLVFMQYYREKDGSLTPLPKPSVDTGLGLERLVRIVQDGESNYETDLFAPAMDRVQELLGDSDEQRAEKYVGYRVIADHGRAATFLIGDGVRPGSSGAGYVLRMVIRRAARFGRSIGFSDPFMAEVAKVFIAQMGEAYPELAQREEHILHTITQEEERFNRTLDAALIHLYNLVQSMRERGEKVISGEEAFNLYATYGLPLEITKDVITEWGVTVDEDGFKVARDAHAEESRSDKFGSYETEQNVYTELLHALLEGDHLEEGVDYDPYGSPSIESEVIGIIQDGKLVETAVSGAKVELITAATPFYVESGGEISDTGHIFNEKDGFEFIVEDTRKPINGLIVHVGEVKAGELQQGQYVRLEVDDVRRGDIRRNHTATHILHHELRAHLGTHVTQQGSLVAPDRLRFDFSHNESVDKKTLASIEADINKAIMENYTVNVEYMGQKEAIQAGAMALFGEKYGDIVRTIQIGHANEDVYSFELCGGLHVSETNDIGQFRFVSEGASSAGVRRVEAVTGRAAQQLIAERLDILDRVAQKMNAPVAELESRVAALQAENKSLQKQLDQMQSKMAAVQFESLMASGEDIAGARVLTAKTDGLDADGLRELADRFRDNNPTCVGVIGSVVNGRPIFVAVVSKDLIGKGVKAGDIVREVAKVVGGGGGGRPDMAQAGGKDASKMDEALAIVPDLVKEILM